MKPEKGTSVILSEGWNMSETPDVEVSSARIIRIKLHKLYPKKVQHEYIFLKYQK